MSQRSSVVALIATAIVLGAGAVGLFYPPTARAADDVPGKPSARPAVPGKRELIAALRAAIAERRSLDGVNVTDLVYDDAGKVALEGQWPGDGMARELGDLLRDILRPGGPALSKNGISLDRLRVVRTDLLLRDLRKWLVDKTEVEEVLFDRLYFDAAGKPRVDGFFTRPADQAPAEKAGLDALLATPSGRALLGLDPEGIVRPRLEGKDVIHLVKRASLVEYLRKQIPADPTLDGVRVDRCWYDAGAVFVVNGLEDSAGQARGLKRLLDAAQEGAAFQDHLPAGWRLGKVLVVPLRKMLHCLQRVMPTDPIYDGMALDRAYHDAANHLVLTGAIAMLEFPGLDQARSKLLNQRREEKARKALAAAIEADPDWRLRLAYGGPDVVLKSAPADLALAERSFQKAVHWYGHERKVARARDELNVTIFNYPADPTAWYFRAVCELALGDDAAARRDLRRVLAFAEGRPPQLDRLIDFDRLEMVQGVNRATASQLARKLALAPAADLSLEALKKELCEESLRAPVPDEAAGWDRPAGPPACPSCGPPCRMPW
jgi:tetratricopeptide (TPR) repeat protein